MSADAHPVKSISEYDETSGRQGAGGEVMESRFSIVLMLEFVGLERKAGDRVNPRQQISFKVFPKGRSNVDGLIIGMPVPENAFWNGNDKYGHLLVCEAAGCPDAKS